MNTLIFVPWENLDALGGVNVVVGQLARYLVSGGDGVRIITPRWSGRVETNETARMTVFRVPMRSPGGSRQTLRARIAFALCLPITLWRLARLMKRERIQAVNAHYFSDHVFYFVLLKRLLRFRLIISVHGCDLLAEHSQANLGLLNRWAPWIDAIVACSESLRNAGLPDGSAASRRAIVLRNCVDVSGVRPADRRLDAIVSVASLEPRKGLDILIRAFAQCTHAYPHWQLWLVGSGELLADLQSLAKELKCEARVQFLGGMARHEALARLAGAKIFCLSSHREGLPLAVLEAMALSTPVVATRVEGTPEAIDDGVHGLLVESGSVEKLRAALETLMSDPQKRGELAGKASARIGEVFSYETWGRQYRAVLAGQVSDRLPACATPVQNDGAFARLTTDWP